MSYFTYKMMKTSVEKHLKKDKMHIFASCEVVDGFLLLDKPVWLDANICIKGIEIDEDLIDAYELCSAYLRRDEENEEDMELLEVLNLEDEEIKHFKIVLSEEDWKQFRKDNNIFYDQASFDFKSSL